MPNTTKKEFRFFVRHAVADGTKRDDTLVLRMTQNEFEDYQYRKGALHKAMAAQGIDPKNAVWHEDPEVSEVFEARLMSAIGVGSDCALIAHYPSSYQHNHYREVVVDGKRVRWMPFQNGQFIKWAFAADSTLGQAAA